MLKDDDRWEENKEHAGSEAEDGFYCRSRSAPSACHCRATGGHQFCAPWQFCSFTR